MSHRCPAGDFGGNIGGNQTDMELVVRKAAANAYLEATVLAANGTAQKVAGSRYLTGKIFFRCRLPRWKAENGALYCGGRTKPGPSGVPGFRSMFRDDGGMLKYMNIPPSTTPTKQFRTGGSAGPADESDEGNNLLDAGFWCSGRRQPA